MVTLPMTSRDPQRCYEAVQSAILATAWLLVWTWVMSCCVCAHRHFLCVNALVCCVNVMKCYCHLSCLV